MKYLRRFVWYLASRLLVITMVAGLMVVTFYYAMNIANIQVVLKDGMAKRAQVIMMNDDEGELAKYFQSAFLERDQALIVMRQGGSPYVDYNVRGIDHRLSMGFVWIWPWDETVRVDITERIPRIDGRVKGSRADELLAQKGDSALYPPAWSSGRYRATLVKENGRWKIMTLTLLEKLDE